MKKWIDPAPVRIPPGIETGYPLLTETLVRRGFTTAEAIRRFLDPDAYQPAPPDDLPDIGRAVERLERAIEHGETILVWGDFDVDGQTATALLVSALGALGAEVRHYIPHRLMEGHGVHIPKLGQLINDGTNLILTCDTGISAHEAVDYANKRGVDTIITDHHQLPPELPAAYAAVNPQRLIPGHPLRTLPGVGCAYKLVQALYSRAGRSDEIEQYLDLVALGIVADVAEQIADTRYLLQRGLNVLRRTERLGLQITMEQARINPDSLDEDNIGFGIAPRLNALGRLDDANAAVEYLTTTDLERARILANQLEALNAQRRSMTEQVYQAAQGQIEQNPKLLDHAVLVLSHETWPGGIVGIVANRLVEQYDRPVILLTTDGDLARGSARSISGCDITAAIAAHAAMLEGYGGHTMAAGLSLKAERIQEFRRAISKTVADMLDHVDTTPKLTISAYIDLNGITTDLLDAIQQLAPFGPGNPPLTLATHRLTLQSKRQIGRTGEHLKLIVADEDGYTHNVVWWKADPDLLPKGRFDLAYTLHANEYQGKREVQMQFVDARPVEEAPQTFAQRSSIEIIDCRELDTTGKFDDIEDALIYVEGERQPGDSIPERLPRRRRDQLNPISRLIMWTAPPGPDELQAVLEATNPDVIYWMVALPGTDSVQLFLRRFGGVVKHVINAHDGQTTLDELAAGMAHRPHTARLGLDWMVAHGHITYREENGLIRIQALGQQDRAAMPGATAAVAAALQEAAAYRAYLRRTDPHMLIRL